jgi:Domain of unknown function (DUF4214)
MDASALGDRQFITALYHLLLGREPDPVGMELYVRRLLSGTSRTFVAQSLLLCDEYARRARSDRQFVTDLYSAVLGRQPSPADDVDRFVEQTHYEGKSQAIATFCKLPEVIRRYSRDDSFLCEEGPFAEAGLVLRDDHLLLSLTTMSASAPLVIDRENWPVIKPFLDQLGLYAVVVQAESVLDGISDKMEPTQGLKRRGATG